MHAYLGIFFGHKHIRSGYQLLVIASSVPQFRSIQELYYVEIMT